MTLAEVGVAFFMHATPLVLVIHVCVFEWLNGYGVAFNVLLPQPSSGYVPV